MCEGKWEPLTEGNQEKRPERGEDLTAYLLPWMLNMPVLEDAVSYVGFANTSPQISRTDVNTQPI